MPSGDPQSLVLRPSKGRLYLLLLMGLALTGMCVLYIATIGGGIAWLGVLFLGTCSLASAVDLLPGATCLHLTSDGFVICHLFRKSPVLRWDEVSQFRVRPHRALVVFDWDRDTSSPRRRINRALLGGGYALRGVWPLKPQALADLMNRWQANCARK